jgi:hypothetical protein
MEKSRGTIRRAQEAVDNIDTMKMWKNAVHAVKWVMDAVSQIAEVRPVSFMLIRLDLTAAVQLHPCAKLAWSILSKIPEVRFLVLSQGGSHSIPCSPCLHQALLQQVQRDDNVQTLLEAILDAFEFAEEADTLRDIRPESRQAKILEDMLRCVSECAEFISSYAEDIKVGMSSWSLSLISHY